MTAPSHYPPELRTVSWDTTNTLKSGEADQWPVVAGRTTEFHLAARRGDRTKLRRMVAAGQDVDAVGKLGETALLTVAMNEKRTRAVLLCGLRLGIRETLGAMTNALDWYGTKWIAEDFLNCGADVLAEAARSWAARNGYQIEYKPHGDTVTWGG